jgi:Ca2+-binding EF-hand superfamily protein
VEGYEWPYDRELFHQLDSDADSTLSRDELAHIIRATLSQLDKDRNGRVDEREWPGGFAQFEDLDQNRDGRVSAEEYFERGSLWQRQQRFHAWDTNSDGIVQSTEWRTDNDLFHRLDKNANSQIEWEEFRSTGVYRSRRH